jgi:hypothetical protein
MGRNEKRMQQSAMEPSTTRECCMRKCRLRGHYDRKRNQ